MTWLYMPPEALRGTETGACSGSRSAPAPVGSISGYYSLVADIELWVTSSGKPSPRPCSWRGWMIDGLTDRQDRQTVARHEVHELQPLLDAARKAWEPYARPVRDLAQRLDSELRPAMWEANRQARAAGLGHRHTTQRHATQAAEAVNNAEAAIASIRSAAHHTRKTSIASRSTPASFKPRPSRTAGLTSTTVNRSPSSTRSSTPSTRTPPGSTDEPPRPRGWPTPSRRCGESLSTHPRSPLMRTPSTRPVVPTTRPGTRRPRTKSRARALGHRAGVRPLDLLKPGGAPRTASTVPRRRTARTVQSSKMREATTSAASRAMAGVTCE